MSTEAQEPDPATLGPVQDAAIGENLYVSNYHSFAIVRFVGLTDFSKGVWVGLEVPTPTGKNDGSVKGKQYFPCKPQHGIFVRMTACSRQIDTGESNSEAAAAAAVVVNAAPPAPPVSSPKANISPNSPKKGKKGNKAKTGVDASVIAPVDAPSHQPPMPMPLPPVPPQDAASEKKTETDSPTEEAPVVEHAPVKAAPAAGVQVLGSLTAADEDLSDSSDEEDEADAGAGYAPPLNLPARDDDSEEELEICLEVPTPAAAKSKKAAGPVGGNSSSVDAMAAYLAAEAEAESKRARGGLSLVSAMQSSVNEIIDNNLAYQEPGHVNNKAASLPPALVPIAPDDAFGASSMVVVETATVAAEPTEADIFGIAYKPFKRTIGAGNKGPSKKKFDDEEEFEKDLQNSVISKEGSGESGGAQPEEDEFDFESDCTPLDSSELRRTLQTAAERAAAEEASILATRAASPTGGSSMEDAAAAATEGRDRDRDTPSPSDNYDAYGDAKDALRAIVDIYGCGLGDQEVVIMNSLGAEAVAASAHHHAPAALGGSVVPGTGTVGSGKGKVAKRTSGISKVRTKIEREKIVEEDEEDYEVREREQEIAQKEVEFREREEMAKLESEWQGLHATPPRPARRKSGTSIGSKSPMNPPSPRPSPVTVGGAGRGSPGDSGAADPLPAEAYDALLSFFKRQNLTQYHSEIVTSVDTSKGSWLLGGNEKLKFDDSEEELKFCFSIALVNYDPVKHRDHFAALKTIYKFFCPNASSTSSAGNPSTPTRGGRQRDVGMVGAHWGNIGFQGLDPCTDINRSMKMLSVLQVLNLIQHYPLFARSLHKLSQVVEKDVSGKINDLTWPFFCVSIGLTKHALQTLRANVLNKRCNKFKSIMTALHEFYRACVYAFAKDMIEKPAVHHAHHLSTLRSAVDNSPMIVLKTYKTFIKKKCAANPGMTPHEALCSIFSGHPCGDHSLGGDSAVNSSPAVADSSLELEDLEFAGLDEIKDNLDNRSPSPDKGVGSGFFSMGRKKGYEASA
jgi:hypothetical protein